MAGTGTAPSPLRIAVIGTNYLGANTAAGMAEFGFDVLGVDIDERRVKLLNEATAPLFEPGLDELLARHVEGRSGSTGRLRFSTSYDGIGGWADVVFLCVGTPQTEGEYAADLSQIEACVTTLAPLLTSPTLVVGRSTVPVGTARRIRDRLRDEAPAGAQVELAWQPEFLREAHGVEDTLRPDRLVFGVVDEASELTLRRVFARPIEDDCPVISCNLETAELVKGAANAFLATKISFINALAELCDVTGADVRKLADALGHDVRIGRRFLDAGIGFGGGCLPKDLRSFMARAGELGVEEVLTFLREVDEINRLRRSRVVDMAHTMLGRTWAGRRVAILGAAFKPGTDDVRDSPALDIAGRLHLHGARVSVYDPQAMDNARSIRPTLIYAESPEDACTDAHLVLHLTPWPEFAALDPERIGEVVAERKLLDGRLSLDAAAWRAAGWTYTAPGLPDVPA